jgi:mannan endo-1,4-beta-mannosidase
MIFITVYQFKTLVDNRMYQKINTLLFLSISKLIYAKMIKTLYIRFAIIIMVIVCSGSGWNEIKLVDNNATAGTKALYHRLVNSTKQGILIGHQDATAYGVGWKYEEGRTTCDIQMVCGDYPAVYGWDIGHIELDDSSNLDTVYFNQMRKLIAGANKRGGISTISWHANNPVTGETSWSEKETVKYILGDEAIKTKFIGWLDKVSEFLKSLKDENGEPIPVIFRPWHEWNGGWFWWGTPHSSNEEYIEFWKLTVETLRDKNNVHNVLYAFSPGSVKNKEEFMSKFPGSDYVDIIGFDIYVYNDDVPLYKNILSENLTLFKEIAQSENKLFAITETGYEGIPGDNWYSEAVYPVIRESGISWILFWRNANTKHHYAPYPGHRSAEDFKSFIAFRKHYLKRSFLK